MERNAKANQLAAMLKFYLYLVSRQDTPFFSRKLGGEDPGNEVDAFYFTREWVGLKKLAFLRLRYFLSFQMEELI